MTDTIPETIQTLLLTCLSDQPNHLGGQHFAVLTEDGWSDFVDLARRQGVESMVYHRLKQAELLSVVPEVQRERLKQSYHGIALTNLRLYAGLKTVLEAFAEHNISVIVLKGAYLAEHVYPNIALRYMCDVDLLVPETDLAKARDLMLELDFQMRESVSSEQVGLTAKHLPPFVKGGWITVELHWRIVDLMNRAHEPVPMPFTEDDLWRRAQAKPIANTETLVLSPEDLIMHLCLHTALQHNFELGLRGLCDLDHFIRMNQDQFNWAALIKRSHQWNLHKAVYLTLRLVQSMLGTSIPKDVLDTLKPSDFDLQFLSWARARIFNGVSSREVPSLYNVVQVHKATGFFGKVKVLRQVIFPKPAVSVDSNMSSGRIGRWTYLQFVLFQRPRRLWQEYGSVLWRLWRKEKAIVDALNREAQGNAIYDWMYR
ncbi:MAG: nucleotidyltransferase family protein [Chloroflexota bacterium]